MLWYVSIVTCLHLNFKVICSCLWIWFSISFVVPLFLYGLDRSHHKIIYTFVCVCVCVVVVAAAAAVE